MNQTFRFRILILCGIAILATVCVMTFLAYYQTKRELVDVGGEMFKKVNLDVIGLMDALNNEVKAGHITLDQAKERVRTYVNGPKLADGNRDVSQTKLSVDNTMYVWAFSYNAGKGQITMHPFSLEGKNGWDYNIKGKYTVRDSWGNINNVGKVFEEIWQNPGEPVYTFLAYQTYYAPWDWIVGAGGREEILYKTRLGPVKLQLFASGFLIFVVTLLISVVVANGINKSLRTIGDRLQQEADNVSSASTRISGSSLTLAQGASEQSASLQEVSSSMEKMNATTARYSQRTKAVAESMLKTNEQVKSSNTALAELGRSMEDIKGSSGRIAKIINTIEGLAFQTNILALNAAVEAARAGEAGLGFAVVADEVRTLAGRCAQAANETSALISESVASAQEGQKRLSHMGAGIVVITESIGNTKTLVDEMNGDSQQQTEMLIQVSQAIRQVGKVTQLTAANAEEASTISSDLKLQVVRVRDSVKNLQSMVSGYVEVHESI